MKVEFIEHYDLAKLRPAEYNPRKINDDSFTALQESLRKFGCIKPVIINGDNGILTAGHQRTKAMKAIGLNSCPAIKITGIKIQDEIKFNLFHNSIETNKSKVSVALEEGAKCGFCILQPEQIRFSKNSNGTVVKEIGQLIIKYGEWGSIVCDERGRVILNSDYAVASKQLRKEVICYVLENEKVEELQKYLSLNYGEYNYEALGVKSYNQLYCQLNRLGNEKKQNFSSTYEQYVIPVIKKDMRVIDFGAGRCAYARLLKRKGYDIRAYEPFYQGANNNIDITAVIGMIEELEKDVKNNGLYDVCVLDSVLNSVVNSEFENLVLQTCNSLLKDNGKLILGTRNIGHVNSVMNLDKASGKARCLWFLDNENFSTTFRNGVWTMQHFHDKASLKNVVSQYFDEVTVYGEMTSSNIYVIASGPKQLPYEVYHNALNIEFNMEYPQGYKHNKHERLVEAIENALKERAKILRKNEPKNN